MIEKIGRPILAMDEAGRGPLAGPVAVGAVFLDERSFLSLRREENWWQRVNDSKKVGAKKRKELAKIIETSFPSRVILVSAVFIDQYGIVGAIAEAAKRIFADFEARKPIILSDGREKFIPSLAVDQRSFIGGDGRLFSIACASILAKVKRDEHMELMAERWSKYGFEKHKGYGTTLHLEALSKFGPCPLHRFSYAPLKNQVSRKSFSLSRL